MILTETQVMIRDAVRDFARAEIAPRSRAFEAAGGYPEDLFPRLAEMGLREKSLARETVLSEVDRLEKDLAVASEESLLYEEEKAQLITRREEAVLELRQLLLDCSRIR